MLISPLSVASNSWKAVSIVHADGTTRRSPSHGRPWLAGWSECGSRFPVSRRLVQDHRDPPQDQDLALVGRPDVCSNTLPSSIRPQARRFPDDSQCSVAACWRITKNASRGDPEEETVVQKLRSSIQRSLAAQFQDLSSSERSWAWPSSQGMHVDGQHPFGVETHDRRGRARPRPARPQLLDRCSVPGKWLPYMRISVR